MAVYQVVVQEEHNPNELTEAMELALTLAGVFLGGTVTLVDHDGECDPKLCGQYGKEHQA